MTRSPSPDPMGRFNDPARLQLLSTQRAAERARAHLKHGDKSVEGATSALDTRLLPIVIEEVGEVSRALNEIALGNGTLHDLRAELVQVGAMVDAWLDHVDLDLEGAR